MIYETSRVRDQLPFKVHMSNGGSRLVSSEGMSVCLHVCENKGGGWERALGLGEWAVKRSLQNTETVTWKTLGEQSLT